MNRKHDNIMQSKGEEMTTLDSNLDVLNNFKDTKTTREDNLNKQAQRCDRLHRELDALKKNGKVEMEHEKRKLNDRYEKTYAEFAEKAKSDAEKDISEIERNIQAQNQRLEDEVYLQEMELQYLEDKTKAF